MRIFLAYAFLSSFLFIGFVAGYYRGKAVVIEKVIDYTCERIEDRKSYELCSLTTEKNLNEQTHPQALSK